VLGWRKFLQAREQTLAAEGAPAKLAGTATVGLDHLGVPPAADGDDLAHLTTIVTRALADPATFFANPQQPVFRRQGSILTFDSPDGSEGENGIARAIIYQARRRERAIVLLPYWNAPRAAVASFGTLLARCAG